MYNQFENFEYDQRKDAYKYTYNGNSNYRLYTTNPWTNNNNYGSNFFNKTNDLILISPSPDLKKNRNRYHCYSSKYCFKPIDGQIRHFYYSDVYG